MMKPASLFDHDCGLLLHITSLPGGFGVGDFGPACLRWIDLLAGAGQSLWQILPLGPSGYGDSPYQAHSAFASNPLFLDPHHLESMGLLTTDEVEGAKLPSIGRADYAAARRVKSRLSRIAAERFFRMPHGAPLRRRFGEYCAAEEWWLDDFSIYWALKEKFSEAPWHLWPAEFRDRDAATLASARAGLAGEILRVRLEQFLLHEQWEIVRAAAGRAGIRIIGDLPIFVAHDSADVWAARHLFRLRADGCPAVVAGVPPDYFSATGQLWGNPLYDWTAHRAEGFRWWRARLRNLLGWVDVIRIDHFRGFAACWEIPGDAPTAESGRWVSAPGAELFETLSAEFGRPLPFIAEDLGVITPDVTELRDRFELPGIRVLQFAFGDDPMRHTFIPEAYKTNCAAYSGTHDNDTVRGWFDASPGGGSVRSAEAIAAERAAALGYFGGDGSRIHLDFIRALFESKAGAVVVPVQDLLGLGSEARMNRPGEVSGSWLWRLPHFDQIVAALGPLRELTATTGRGTPHFGVAAA